MRPKWSYVPDASKDANWAQRAAALATPVAVASLEMTATSFTAEQVYGYLKAPLTAAEAEGWPAPLLYLARWRPITRVARYLAAFGDHPAFRRIEPQAQAVIEADGHYQCLGLVMLREVALFDEAIRSAYDARAAVVIRHSPVGPDRMLEAVLDARPEGDRFWNASIDAFTTHGSIAMIITEDHGLITADCYGHASRVKELLRELRAREAEESP